MAETLRILQTGPMRLDEPARPLVDVPAALPASLRETRFLAARRACEAAVAHRVDLVILAGGAGDATRDARSLWFMREQCRQLGDAGIDVVWAVHTKPDAQYCFDRLPHVRFLETDHSIGFRLASSRSAVEIEWSHLTGEPEPYGQTSDMAILLRCDPAGKGPKGPMVTAVGYTLRESTNTTFVPVDGRQQAGSLQDELAPQLVECTPHGGVSARTIPLNVLHRIAECVPVDETSTPESVANEMLSRIRRHCASSPAAVTVIDWTVTGDGSILLDLTHRPYRERLLDDLRQVGTADGKIVWSTGIACQPRSLDAWNSHAVVGSAMERLDELIGIEGQLHRGRLQELIPPPAWIGQTRHDRDQLRLRLIGSLLRQGTATSCPAPPVIRHAS